MVSTMAPMVMEEAQNSNMPEIAPTMKHTVTFHFSSQEMILFSFWETSGPLGELKLCMGAAILFRKKASILIQCFFNSDEIK